MAYSTPALVRKALVPSSDGSQSSVPTLTAADLTDGQLTDAIAEADAIIDGYLTRMYTVPVAQVGGSVPHPIDFWSRNIAAYNATLSFRQSQDFTDQDPVARRYMATMDALKQVGQGTVGLNLPRNVTDSGGAGAQAPINPYVGELFCVGDFDLTPASAPTHGPFWRGRW